MNSLMNHTGAGSGYHSNCFFLLIAFSLVSLFILPSYISDNHVKCCSAKNKSVDNTKVYTSKLHQCVQI